MIGFTDMVLIEDSSVLYFNVTFRDKFEPQ